MPRPSVDILRGDNAGRTVVYANVVRTIIPAGTWHGDKLDLSLPIEAIVGTGTTRAALRHVDGTAPIIGAGGMPPPTQETGTSW